jgi:hypothetical protein
LLWMQVGSRDAARSPSRLMPPAMPSVMPVGQFIRSLTSSQFFGTRWIRLFGGQRSSANLTSASGSRTTISMRARKCRCVTPLKPAVSRVVPQRCAPLRQWSRSQRAVCTLAPLPSAMAGASFSRHTASGPATYRYYPTNGRLEGGYRVVIQVGVPSRSIAPHPESDGTE